MRVLSKMLSAAACCLTASSSSSSASTFQLLLILLLSAPTHPPSPSAVSASRGSCSTKAPPRRGCHKEKQGTRTVYFEENWASNASDRGRTSSAVMLHATFHIKTPIALSLAESELYAPVKASSGALEYLSVIRKKWMRARNPPNVYTKVLHAEPHGGALGVLACRLLSSGWVLWDAVVLKPWHSVGFGFGKGGVTPSPLHLPRPSSTLLKNSQEVQKITSSLPGQGFFPRLLVFSCLHFWEGGGANPNPRLVTCVCGRGRGREREGY